MVKKSMRIKKKYNRKSKKGGFFFSKKALPEICNMTNVDDLKTSAELNTRYENCCPKNFLGFKNRSPLCTNIGNKLKEFSNSESSNVSDSVQSSLGLSADISQTPLNNQSQDITTPIATTNSITPTTKPWYQFWGGKKHRRLSNKKSKYSKKGKKSKTRRYKK